MRPAAYSGIDEKDKESRGQMNNRMYRRTSEQIIGGVAAGVARVIGIAPVWVRLGFVVGAIATHGAFLWGYLLLWAITPSPASTASDVGGVLRENLNEVLARVGFGPLSASHSDASASASTMPPATATAAQVDSTEAASAPAASTGATPAWGPRLVRLIIFGSLFFGLLNMFGMDLFHSMHRSGYGYHHGPGAWPVLFLLFGAWWFFRRRRHTSV